jgi:hypothetical protein
MKPYALSILIVFLLASCASSNDHIKKSIIDKSLHDAYIDYNKSIKKGRSALLFEDEYSVSNCSTYFELSDKKNILETVNNQIVKSEYLVCDALKIISSSKIYSGNIDKTQIGIDLLTKLDIRSFPNSLTRMAEDGLFTLRDILPDQSFSKSASVVYESDDWFFSLYVVAVLNINNNLWQDWVVFLSDESKSGNYRNYATLIIYDPENNETLKAEPF